MARIRSIKPEFWDSPSTAKASAVARLAFIGMWNWADDFGRGTANLKELEGFIFPNDDIWTLSGGTSENFRQVMSEVAECFDVTFYTVRGRPYYAIPSWSKHQRNERSAKAKYPGPEEADQPSDLRRDGTSENLRHDVTEAPKSSGLGTGEQGNRGTVDILSNPDGSDDPPTSPDQPPDQALDQPSDQNPEPTPKPTTYPADFITFWETYPRREKKRAALTAYRAAKKRASSKTITEAAARYRDDPNREPAFTKLPATWLNADCWEDEPLPPRHTTTDRGAQILHRERAWAKQADQEDAFTQLEIGSNL
jgi:hypothetical protein